MCWHIFTSSLSNTWQIIFGVIPITLSSSPAFKNQDEVSGSSSSLTWGSTRLLAMITTNSPMSAM